MAPIIFLLNRTNLKNLGKEQQGKPGERNERARFNEVVSISKPKVGSLKRFVKLTYLC